MKIEDMKVGMQIKDIWFSYHGREPWGSGVVMKVLKTRVHVDFFLHGRIVYDKAHLQFVEENPE